MSGSEPATSAEKIEPALVARLLFELAEAMHVLAIPSDTIEASLKRIATRHGLAAHLVISQSYVIAQIGETWVRRIAFDTHWRLARVQDVLDLVRTLAAGRIGCADGRAELRRIC